MRGRELTEFTVRRPVGVADALVGEARLRDVTPGQIIRDLLCREYVEKPAKGTRRADEPPVARLQRRLVPTMGQATTWASLGVRLVHHGYELRPAAGGLALHDSDGTRLCKSSELGFACARLVRQFGAPMPGHPHRMGHLMNRQDDIMEARNETAPNLSG